ncbi:MAG: hypothetical protein L6R38_006877 [Xanthoria sp. 2 TBL-2021]|nr:MAG: hypothetical protein L6R38_006877 [Xanthoria sp. 2 TBL-2021]
MPTYAILGATGKTGGALLELLQKGPSNNINAYVRSKVKLLEQRPGLEKNKNVKIFEGSLSDIPLIASTLNPRVDAAFCVLATNENIPGVRIAQDTASSVIAALCHLRNEDIHFKPPKLIFLSSASLNAAMLGEFPAAVEAIITRAMSHVYADLRFAEENLRLHRSWLDATFVQPGGLTEDVQKGHKLSVDKASDGFVSYLDLAAGMIEIADSGTYNWMGVSVNATAKDVKFEPNAPPQILRGLVWHFAPWLYWTCRSLRMVS